MDFWEHVESVTLGLPTCDTKTKEDTELLSVWFLGLWLVWPLSPSSPLTSTLFSSSPSPAPAHLCMSSTWQSPWCMVPPMLAVISLPLLLLSLLPHEVLLNTLSVNNSRGCPLFSEFPHEASWLWFIWLFHTSEVRAGGRTVTWASGGGHSRPMFALPSQILASWGD